MYNHVVDFLFNGISFPAESVGFVGVDSGGVFNGETGAGVWGGIGDGDGFSLDLSLIAGNEPLAIGGTVTAWSTGPLLPGAAGRFLVSSTSLRRAVGTCTFDVIYGSPKPAAVSKYYNCCWVKTLLVVNDIESTVFFFSLTG